MMTNGTPSTGASSLDRKGLIAGLAEGFKYGLVSSVIGGVLVTAGWVTSLTIPLWGGLGFAIGFADGWINY